ncbi:MAG: hypothetical protein RL219_1140 [Actinomycetota bacterium]
MRRAQCAGSPDADPQWDSAQSDHASRPHHGPRDAAGSPSRAAGFEALSGAGILNTWPSRCAVNSIVVSGSNASWSATAHSACGAVAIWAVWWRPRPNTWSRASRVGRVGSRTRWRHVVAATANAATSHRPSGSMNASDEDGRSVVNWCWRRSKACALLSRSVAVSDEPGRTSIHRSGASRAGEPDPCGHDELER